MINTVLIAEEAALSSANNSYKKGKLQNFSENAQLETLIIQIRFKKESKRHSKCELKP